MLGCLLEVTKRSSVVQPGLNNKLVGNGLYTRCNSQMLTVVQVVLLNLDFHNFNLVDRATLVSEK